ncbi:MAG: hypothetical protein HRF49_12345 [bacterium]
MIARGLAALAAFFVFALSFPSAAQGDRPAERLVVSYEIGPGNVPHLGRINPITLEITNPDGKPQFAGKARVSTGENVIESNIFIAPGATVVEMLPVDFDPPPNSIEIVILDGAGRIAWEKSGNLSSAAAPEDAVLLVIDEKSGGLSYLNGMDVLTRRSSYFSQFDTKLLSGSIKVGTVPLSRLLSAGPLYLKAVDVLVVRDGDYSRIAERDAAGLAAFAASGGVLVLCHGVAGPKAYSSPLGNFMPQPISSAEPSSDLGQLAELGGVPIPNSVQVMVAAGQKPAANAETIAGSDYPLIVKKDYGLGTVIQMNLDYSEPSIRGWAGWNTVWRRLLIGPLCRGRFEEHSINPGNMAALLKDIPQAKPVQPRVASFFILLYVVLVGPVNYLLVARRKNRVILWATIPAVIILFTGFGVLLGYLTRGTQNIVRQIDEVHVFQDVPVALARANYLQYSSFSTKSGLNVKEEAIAVHTSVPPEQKEQSRYGYPQPVRTASSGLGAVVRTRPTLSVERRLNKWTPYITWFDGFIPGNFGEARWDESREKIEYSFPRRVMDSWILSRGLERSLGQIAQEGWFKPPEWRAETRAENTRFGSLYDKRHEIVAAAKKSLDSSGLGRDELKFCVFLQEPSIELAPSSRFSSEAASFVVHHLPAPRGTPANPSINIEPYDFEQPQSAANIGSSYFGYGDVAALAELRENGRIDFAARITPVDPNANYSLSVNVSTSQYWSGEEGGEFEVSVRGLAVPARVVSQGSREARLTINGSDIQGETLFITVKSLKDTLYLTDIKLALSKASRSNA